MFVSKACEDDHAEVEGEEVAAKQKGRGQGKGQVVSIVTIRKRLSCPTDRLGCCTCSARMLAQNARFSVANAS